MGRKLEWKLYQTVNVTEQGGTQPPGTLTHDPTISVEENRFFLTVFQPQDWGSERIPAQILSHETQSLPCSPKGYKLKPWPEVPRLLTCL